MDRDGLADFLRGRRARVRPVDAGLPAGTRRRTPGLRREEVAGLAGISVDYYARLEQRRGPHPSRQVLSALARALRLSDQERDHLYRLAGEAPGPPEGLDREVSQGIQHLLGRMVDTAALVLDAKYDILAWNPLASALMGDLSTVPSTERNLIWQVFCGPRPPAGSTVEPDDDDFLDSLLGDLRAATAKYPRDPEIRSLVARLRSGSPEFTDRWGEHRVCIQHTGTCKRLWHPLIGAFRVECQLLRITDRDQRLLTYTAAPGSSGEEALRLLSVVGTQDLAPAAAPVRS